MKFTVVNILLGIFCLLSGSSLYSQTYKEDMKRIKANYQAITAISMEYEMKMFSNPTTTVPTEKETGILKKNGKLYYAKLFNRETVINKSYSLIVDHERKTIMIDKVLPVQGVMPKPFNFNADTIFSKAMNAFLKTIKPSDLPEITTTEPAKDLRSYTVQYKKGEYKSVSVLFNTKTLLISKITLVLRKPEQINPNEPPAEPRVEISYNKIDIKTAPANQVFSEENFITIKNDGYIQLKPVVANYKVINHLKKQKA